MSPLDRVFWWEVDKLKTDILLLPLVWWLQVPIPLCPTSLSYYILQLFCHNNDHGEGGGSLVYLGGEDLSGSVGGGGGEGGVV